MDNILLFSDRVWLAENADNGNLRAKFLICDFSVNRNGVQLNRDTIENWMQSMVNQPLVGKIKKSNRGETDFTGHNMKKSFIKDEDGNYQMVVEMDTDALGTFVDVGIETIDDAECLVGTAEIWNRYPRAVKLIQERIEEGTLHTSWEISVESVREENGVRIIDNGTFTALAMLGRTVEPAYESSRLLEVAESEIDEELDLAIAEDMKDKENGMKAKKKSAISDEEEVNTQTETETEKDDTSSENQTDSAEQSGDSENQTSDNNQGNESDDDDNNSSENDEESGNTSEGGTETSVLTQWDLYDRITKACLEKLGIQWGYISQWFPANDVVWFRDCEHAESELDYVFFVYSVMDDDSVTVDDGIPVKLTVSVAELNDVLAQKDDAIAQAALEISELKTQLQNLESFKTAFEQAEADRVAAERAEKSEALKGYALKSGLIAEDELESDEIAPLISEADEDGIKRLIATRYMESLGEKTHSRSEADIAQLAVKRYKAQQTSRSETDVEIAQKQDGLSETVNLTSEEVKPVKQNAVLAYIAR